jgi:hypothetical protein
MLLTCYTVLTDENIIPRKMTSSFLEISVRLATLIN